MPVETPSILYYLALIAWPFIAFRLYKKYKPERAFILLLVLPYLFLPGSPRFFNPIVVPVLGPLDKDIVPVLVLLALVWIKKIPLNKLPKLKLGAVLVVCLFIYPILTMITNRDSLTIGPKVLPGLSIKDAIYLVIDNFLHFYLPFVVGLTYLRTNEAHEEFIKVVFILGLFYTLPMLWEIRMSPQLHTHIYGFFPHSFGQQKRGDGFRPVVFLGHGLLVALYCSVTLMCALVLWRNKNPILKNKGFWVFIYLVVVLVLCKTFSAIIYFLLFMSVVVFIRKPEWRLNISVMLALSVLFLPVLRYYLPLMEIVEFFAHLDAERAGSLQFRLHHEDLLLDKGLERPWFGWGTWGRNRIFDPVSGADLSVTDGMWIILFGSFGWLGYLAIFGLLVYPLIALSRSLTRKNSAEFSSYTLALAMILAIVLVDQVPNASATHFLYLMAGALLGRAEELRDSLRRKGQSGIALAGN